MKVMKVESRIKYILDAYLTGKATAEERSELEEWVKLSKENIRYFQETRNIRQVLEPPFDPSEIDVFVAERNMLRNIACTKRRFTRTLLIYWQRVAAVLVLPLLLVSIWLLLEKNESASEIIEYQEIKSPHGTFSAINLPDGTDVWLNGGSSLRYPLKFKKGERKVFLSGEGYFEVRSDKENPFIVKTNQITLKATGTAFNIEAYKNDSVTAVTMVNGKINVSFGESSPVEMIPGERAFFNYQSKQCRIIKTDPYKWYAWKDGLMIFRDDPLWYVFKRVGQTFNVNIELKDSSLANAPYRATFENESLDEILRLLKMSAPIRFKQIERTISSNGTYGRQTIEVFREKK